MFDSWRDPVMPVPPEDEPDLDGPRALARAEAVDRDIGELASHINASMARLLDAVAEFDALGTWATQEAKGPDEWLSWRCGLTIGEARTHVRVARALKKLPAIRAAFSRGELSYYQVRAMARIATPEIEDSLVEMARHSTATQLQRIARAYKGCLDRIELERSNERHQLRSLAFFYDDDGFLIVRGRLTPDDGAVLVAALDAAEKALEEEIATDDSGSVPAEARRADALVEVARRSQSVAADAKEPRTEAVVHVDLASLIDGSGERCEIEDGPALASETAQRLCCDATIQALFERGGEVLDFGRRKRTIPPRLRKALEQRDVTCRFPGCDRKRFRKGHHIVFWGHGHEGKTNPHNCVLLCFHHHRLVHEGGYRIEGDPEGHLSFIRPDGRFVPDTNRLGNGDPRELIRKHKEMKLAIDDRTCTSLWDGYRLRRVCGCVIGAGRDLGVTAPWAVGPR